MFKKDYLQNQIEQLARVLGKLLAELLGTKLDSDFDSTFQKTNDAFLKHLGISLTDTLAVKDNEFLPYLADQGVTDELLLDKLAQIYEELGWQMLDHNDPAAGNNMLSKALEIYNHLINNSTNYSLEWMYKIEEIRTQIKA